MGPLAGALLGTALFALQIPLSAWWLRRFCLGRVEWLWRCLIFAKVQTFEQRMKIFTYFSVP